MIMEKKEFSIGDQFDKPTDTILNNDKDKKPELDKADDKKDDDTPPAIDPPVKKDDEPGDKITPEKLTEVYTKLGGTSVDDNGNLLNESGKIVKTALEVQAELKKINEKKNDDDADDNTPVELTLDDDGNLVDADGNVVHEKDTFAYDEKTGEVTFNEEPLVESLAASFREAGYKLVDETGQPLTFEDSEEGTKQLVETLATEAYQSAWDKVYEQYPVAEKFMNHLQAGKDPQDFFRLYSEKVDYTKIDVPEDNVEGRKAVIAEYLSVVANNDKDTIDILLKTYEDTGEVDVKYNDALAKLKSHQKAADDAESQRLAQEAQAAARQQQEYWGEVKKTVTAGKLDNIVIPEAEREAFYDYVARRTEKGVTKAAEDYRSLPLDKQLQLDYLLYKGFDLDTLVKARVNQEKVDAFKARQKKAKPVVIKTGARYRKEDTGGRFSTKTIS